MQLVELKTFLAVAEEKSFSAAALRLYITQPAISKRIQSLENHLGTSLFDRIGKRVYLTEAGTLLIDRATAILRLAKDTEKEIFNLNDTISGRLNLATSHHIGLHRLAPVLKDFSKRYPEVQLDIQFEDSEVAYQMVRSGQVEGLQRQRRVGDRWEGRGRRHRRQDQIYRRKQVHQSKINRNPRRALIWNYRKDHGVAVFGIYVWHLVCVELVAGVHLLDAV